MSFLANPEFAVAGGATAPAISIWQRVSMSQCERTDTVKTKVTWLLIGVVIGALGMYLYIYNALSHLFGK